MAAKRDYYEVLGVSREADERVVKKAFREKSLKYHPDRNAGDKEAEEQFKLVAEAYEVISNPDKRRLYDQFGHEGVSGAGFSGFQNADDIFSHFSDIFGEFFGFGQRRSRTGPARGDDLQIEVELSYEDAARGVTRDLPLRQRVNCEACTGTGAQPGSTPEPCPTCQGHGEVRMRQGFLLVTTACPQCRGEGRIIKKPCQTCQGQGQKTVEQKISVEIPAGIDDGMRIRHRGKGGAGRRSGPAGDLYVQIRLAEHPHFVRHGYDIHSEAAISYARAALGLKLKLPTLWGEQEVEIPAGTQPNDKITLRGVGFPRLAQEGRGQGDHIVHVRVEIPHSLSPEEAELLAKLAALEEKSQNGHANKSSAEKNKGKRKSLFQRIKEAVE
jgi:molecular chaperone DnaJ